MSFGNEGNPLFFFPQPYTHSSTYKVYVYQPREFPYFIGNNFVRYRHFIEHLAPFRMNSLVVRDEDSSAKVLMFLVDGNVHVQQFVKQIKKHFNDDVKIEIMLSNI